MSGFVVVVYCVCCEWKVGCWEGGVAVVVGGGGVGGEVGVEFGQAGSCLWCKWGWWLGG